VETVHTGGAFCSADKQKNCASKVNISNHIRFDATL